jgi:lipid-A-disaccharide synthase
MKYYLIAGEASGDLHGSNLIKAIRQKDPTADIRCWGGDKMQAAGATLVKHYRELAFMGFIEVVMNLRTILRNISFCKKDITKWQPDVLVFIDYPGFNIKIAEWAKPLKYKTVWYISPQVWAWKESRVKILRRCVDKMLCILPFEKAFYQKWNYEVEYVGHPLIEVVKEAVNNEKSEDGQNRTHHSRLTIHDSRKSDSRKIIALLPGSRKQEILKKLPVMLEVARRMPNYDFVLAKAPGQEDAFYEPLLQAYQNVSAVRDATYELLQRSTAALVTSGTATLETALFGVPEVVCYKGSKISYEIAKRLIKIKYISLVNLIMDRPVVKELIQDEMNADNVQAELEKILNDTVTYNQIKKDYAELWNVLSAGGNASEKAAEIVVKEATNATTSAISYITY